MEAVLLIALVLGAGGDTLTYRGDRGQLDVSPPRIDSPAIRVDASLDEEAWSRAAVLSGFTRFYPTEGVPAWAPTSVRVFYNSDAIFFGIEARDPEPSKVFANYSERDETVFGNDRLAILLDTFAREQRAYVFYVNPLGLQTDGLWKENSSEGGRPTSGIGPVDVNPDFIWQSAGRVSEEGWQVEIRIPFVSLRFPEGKTKRWGINVLREIRRWGYQQSWAPLSESQSSTLGQQGYLIGMEDIEPRRLVEMNPVMTGSLAGETQDGEFERGGVSPEFGFNTRLGLTSELTLGATVNPDFSQVEADAEQITVNERFALFFPEKRPFFLDGTEIFDTPMRLVHTRRIVEPVGGVKLSGRIGALDLAYLGTLDESSRNVGGSDDRALFNLARVERSFDDGSTVGVLYTDRTEIGDGTEANRVAAADARLRFGESNVLTLQAAGAWTTPSNDSAAVDETGSSPTQFGQLLQVGFNRSGRNLSFQFRLEDTSEDFEARSGLIRRIGDARVFGEVELDHYPEEGSFIGKIGVAARTDNYFGHSDLWDLRSPFERAIELEPSLSLRGGNPVSLTLASRYYRFRPRDYLSYALEEAGEPRIPFDVPGPLEGMLGLRFSSRYRFSSALSVEGGFRIEEVPLFAEASRGRNVQFSSGVEVRPDPHLALEFTHTHSGMTRDADGSQFSTADIPRLRAQYMFNRSLFVRLIGQYRLEQRAALTDPRTGRRIWVDGDRSEAIDFGAFGGQALVSFEPSPGTIFFVGWFRRMEGPRSVDFGELDLVEESFFMKASYLHRF